MCRDYAAKFTEMLDNSRRVLSARSPNGRLQAAAGVGIRYVFHLAQYLREAGGNERARVLRQRHPCGSDRGRVARLSIHEDGSPRRDLSCFPQGFGDVVARDYAGAVDELIAYGFPSFDLDKAARQQLRDIGVFCVVKDLFLEDVTGLVFAWFWNRRAISGRGDLFPVGDRRRNRQARRIQRGRYRH